MMIIVIIQPRKSILFFQVKFHEKKKEGKVKFEVDHYCPIPYNSTGRNKSTG
jgi:hypothetical protein